MNAPIPIIRERVEIGRVLGNGDCEWMILVLDGDVTVDAGFYRSREAAVVAAETWDLPIRHVREVGTITTEVAA